MRYAAKHLDGKLFVEYWGQDYAPEDRITEWLNRADIFATEWVPSEVLFVG